MALGMSFVQSGFLGGLIDGFKEMKGMQDRKTQLEQQMMGLNLEAMRTVGGTFEGGKLVPGDPSLVAMLNPESATLGRTARDITLPLIDDEADRLRGGGAPDSFFGANFMPPPVR